MPMHPSRHLPIVILLLVAVVPLILAGPPFRVCEDSKQDKIADAGSSEGQLLYNPLRREYFSVYLYYEGQQSSVVGQRFDERGTKVGGVIPIFPWNPNQAITQNRKQFPVVAHNTNTDSYLVAWEFDFNGDGKDWDVVARVVSGDGTPHGNGVFFLASSFGREDSPHLAFSPDDNSYVLVHEMEDRLSGIRGISAQRLNETHTLGAPILLNTTYADREPFVAYHPPTKNFLLVWERDQANKSDIGAVLLTGTPIRALSTTPTIVGSTIEVVGDQVTAAHDHDAQLVYSPADDIFLLTWEVDGDSGEKEVVCNLVYPNVTRSFAFRVVGNASHPYDRKPSAVYSHYSNEFFIAYESGPNNVSTGIEGAAFASKNLRRSEAPFPVSQALDHEHAPTVALSTTCGSIFALWSSDASARRSAPRSSTPAPAKKPAATFAETVLREEASPLLSVAPNTLRSKFSLGLRARGAEEAVPHVYLPNNLPVKASSLSAATSESLERMANSSSSSLQSIRICLPGRGSCSAAGSPIPLPSPNPKKDGGDETPVAGVVLGLLGAGVVLAGVGVGGYVGWRRYPQIREWWENRRASYAATGVWAEESEFSISVDAFTGSGDNDATEEQEEN